MPLGAQVPLPPAGRRPGAADRLQGGRLGLALKAKLVEQREIVEALGGLRRKLVADRVETTESAVRTFGLHGALSRLSAAGLLSSAMLPQKFSRAAPSLQTVSFGKGRAVPHVSNPGQFIYDTTLDDCNPQECDMKDVRLGFEF